MRPQYVLGIALTIMFSFICIMWIVPALLWTPDVPNQNMQILASYQCNGTIFLFFLMGATLGTVLLIKLMKGK